MSGIRLTPVVQENLCCLPSCVSDDLSSISCEHQASELQEITVTWSVTWSATIPSGSNVLMLAQSTTLQRKTSDRWRLLVKPNRSGLELDDEPFDVYPIWVDHDAFRDHRRGRNRQLLDLPPPRNQTWQTVENGAVQWLISAVMAAFQNQHPVCKC